MIKRPRGRPPKPTSERQEKVTIRLSKNMKNALEAKAKELNTPWQTYIKQLVVAHLKKDTPHV